MLDLRFVRDNPETVRDGLSRKSAAFAEDVRLGRANVLGDLLALDAEHRALIRDADALKAERNRVSEEVAQAKRAGADAGAMIAAMRETSERIARLDERLRETEARVERLALAIPNLPHASVPPGRNASDNVEVRRGGPALSPDFDVQPHWEIGERLGLFDLARAAKISGSGFPLFRGVGARLERALINWMIDLHTKEHGYEEVLPPHLVTRAAMTGTGQLPKMEEDMYRADADDLFLIPTAEVPVTNIHRDEILDAGDLPRRYVAYTPCYRREAGSAGRDTRGLTRVHQFDKVELVKLVRPESSYDELEALVADTTRVLDLLGLPYRVIALCSGDLSFAAAKCYDLEVMSPATGKWLEVSSCSNFEDFQARRANIRYRPGEKEKPRFVHTLNGSGLALPRTVIGILENYQTRDGTVRVPEVLRQYMGGLDVIR
jgi:seryl-tRNA synthetase